MFTLTKFSNFITNGRNVILFWLIRKKQNRFSKLIYEVLIVFEVQSKKDHLYLIYPQLVSNQVFVLILVF